MEKPKTKYQYEWSFLLFSPKTNTRNSRPFGIKFKKKIENFAPKTQIKISIKLYLFRIPNNPTASKQKRNSIPQIKKKYNKIYYKFQSVYFVMSLPPSRRSSPGLDWKQLSPQSADSLRRTNFFT